MEFGQYMTTDRVPRVKILTSIHVQEEGEESTNYGDGAEGGGNQGLPIRKPYEERRTG